MLRLHRNNACFVHLIFFPYSKQTNVMQNKPKVSFVIFFFLKKSVITFHIVIDVSISSLLKFSLEVWGGRFFRSEVMLQEGFTLNG